MNRIYDTYILFDTRCRHRLHLVSNKRRRKRIRHVLSSSRLRVRLIRYRVHFSSFSFFRFQADRIGSGRFRQPQGQRKREGRIFLRFFFTNSHQKIFFNFQNEPNALKR